MPGTKKDSESIEFLNADGTPGGRMSKDKYDATKKVLLQVIPKKKEGILFRDLAHHVQDALPKDLLPAKGSASWLATTVKLDLEAHGVIERVPDSKPQRVRRT